MFQPRQPYATQAELDADRTPQPPGSPGVQAALPITEGSAGGNDMDGDENGGADFDRDGDGNMLVPRDPEIRRPNEPPEPSDKVELFRVPQPTRPDRKIDEEARRRHAILMASLDEEGERQREEREQAQIDDDYYHHQQWKPEEARVLLNRGQAPLVFNEARGAIDWLCGTERKLRKDYKIRPRSPQGEAMAETKTKVFKYIDDVNLAPWHRSRAFKQCATSGLGWLEEALTTDPERELIYSGSEDWRRMMRDSRGREFDQQDWRYIHRRKILDLDYAVCLLPIITQHLIAIAGRWAMEDDEADDVWYLGQKLTSAHAHDTHIGDGLWGDEWRVRRAGASLFDNGRRNSVEIIETWYRVPECVNVFADGPLYRKVVNTADPRHQQLLNDRWPTYEAVKMRMRCMVGTKYLPGWDGPSPYNHGQFPFIPVWGYRRDRDGHTYGAMRGMRDPQDDLNKRRSKALYALSATRTKYKKGVFEDPELAREEIARVDAMIEVDGDPNTVSIESAFNAQQVQGNMEMAQMDVEHIRNSGGVTGENLGHDTNATSGKAIIARQEQGSMVTFELFDNYYLAFKMAGQRRMANIEQFCNQPWTFRLDPQGMRPAEWVTVNKYDPRTGQYLNDITADQADFIVDQQDYRATLTMAAMDAMFELLGQLAQFAPQVTLNLLDLAVENADIPGKEEWVARIRKLTGQRDPSKPPTPEEQAQDQQNMAQQQAMNQITMETAQAKLDEIRAKITNSNADAVMKKLQGLLFAIQGAVQVAVAPGVAPAADQIAGSAGFEDANTPPAQPALPAPTNTAPGAVPAPASPPAAQAVPTQP
jgi:hypothetical protein